MRQWRHPPAAAQDEGLRLALLRGIYDQNRAQAVPPGLRRLARHGEHRARLRRLAIPVALLAAIPAAMIFAAWNSWSFSGRPLPALLSSLAAGPRQGPSPVDPSHPAFLPLPENAVPPARLASEARASRAATAATAGEADSLAEVAPLLSGKEDLKNLFGLSVKTIVIDAGHGGHDPGAVGRMGTLEKDVTLDIARRLKARLEGSGAYRVLLVRDADSFVSLRQRAAFANAHPTDLFVSIHVNFLPGSSTNAVEAYYFGRHRDARTRRVAERENQGSDYALSEFEDILRNMQDALKLQQAKALAHSIQGSMLARIRAEPRAVMDNGVRPAPFVVLLGVKAPAVLVEIGSLSSPEAERNLGQEAYREQIASYVVAGITDHLDQQTAQEDQTHGKEQGRLAQRQ
jgi:N-acetylmuramoyl-L-alanine amidase